MKFVIGIQTTENLPDSVRRKKVDERETLTSMYAFFNSTYQGKLFAQWCAKEYVYVELKKCHDGEKRMRGVWTRGVYFCKVTLFDKRKF